MLTTGLSRSTGKRPSQYVYDPERSGMLPSKASQTKNTLAKTSNSSSSASKTSTKLTSDESRTAKLPTATKHRDDIYTNNEEPAAVKSEEIQKTSAKVKNVLLDSEEDEDPELDTTELHRKITRYCDLHGKPGHEFLDWIDNIDRGNPKIKQSLDKPLDAYPGGTLLHGIVRGPHQKIEQVIGRFQRRYELLRWLLESYPELYAERDHEDHTVLEEAMLKFHSPKLNGVNPFVEYFVREFPAETAQQLNRTEDDGNSLKAPIFLLIPMVCGPDIEGNGCLGALLPYVTETTLRQTDENRNTVLHLAARYKYACDETPDSQELLKRQIENLVNTHPDIICALNKDKESPYLHRVNSAREYITQNGGDLLTHKSDVITDFLKDRCMHRPIEEAVDLLYGRRSGPEHQITLNLQELSRGRGTITKRQLIKFLDRFHFESILQFVDIPRLILAPDKTALTAEKPAKLSRKGTSITSGIGREECLEILKYLQEKGVRKIIELVVDDDQDPPHKDTIIASLNTFDLEIFDWKKLDLCSDTIFKAAPYAQKIVLYSSGNNAVLRSWSAADGLGRFTRLTEVDLYVRQRIESSAATKEMIAQFKDRMASNCPQVPSDNLYVKEIRMTETAIMAASGAVGGNTPGGAEPVSLNINAWMSTMESFATFIRNIADAELPSDRRPIKVAVIDDGIDAVYNEEQFSATLKGGESFCTGRKRPPYFFSSTGHGTLMADLVQRVCPKVHLYVARLDELQGELEGRVHPTAESAAKAIRWAIQQDVDVISMSWTVRAKDEHIIRSAIQEADNKNILLFGSASDQGYNAAAKVYPAEYEQVFCIGAAKSTGHTDSAAELQAKYVFPGGEWSEIKASRGAKDGALDHAWGSSFACALAAGLAALILDCTEIAGLGKLHRDSVRKRENMDAIFSSMIREKGSKYIPVTQYFTPEITSSSWDSEGKQKFRKMVKTILRPILE